MADQYVKQLDIGEGENAQTYPIKDAEARDLIDALQAENADLKEQITELNSEIGTLNSLVIAKTGDSITLSDIWINGVLTGGNTTVYATIPITQNIQGSSYSFAPTSLTIRQNNSYLANALTDFSDITVGAYQRNPVGIMIAFDNSSGWGGTNNSPVACVISGTLTIN